MAPSFVLNSVGWNVRDLRGHRQLASQLGFLTHLDPSGALQLSSGRAPLMTLKATPNAHRREHRGAYHVAINLPQRRDLAALLQRIATERIAVEGFADHRITEALYLPDAEGNGLEFTWDRPRSKWRTPGGALEVTVDPLDIVGLFSELGSSESEMSVLPKDAFVGHVHLYAHHPADEARWYQHVFGMELVTSGPWGIFLSRDGYHHHIALRHGHLSEPQNELGLAWIDASLEQSAFDAIDAEALEGVKQVTAPSGQVWRLQAVPAAPSLA